MRAADCAQAMAYLRHGNLFIWNNILSHWSYKNTGANLTEIALET